MGKLGRGPGHCQCINTRMERFLEPCLLVLLAEQPSYGYQLMERLSVSSMAEQAPDAGLVYRTLRRLEQEGMVHSVWETGSTGPARRQYTLTADGNSYLAAWEVEINRTVSKLQGFLKRYESVRPVMQTEVNGHSRTGRG